MSRVTCNAPYRPISCGSWLAEHAVTDVRDDEVARDVQGHVL